MEASIIVYLSSGVKFLEFQSFVIEEFLSFRISCNEDLEAAVEEETVDNVGTDTATDGVGSFYKEERDVIGGEPGRGS